MDPFNPFSLKDKTILVTGASSGIGQGIAIACSKMGAIVVLNGRDIAKLNTTKSQLNGVNHIVLAADLLDAEAVSKQIEKCPQLDGVVHCAGIGQRVPCKLLEASDVDIVMDTNFKAHVMLQVELLKQRKINKQASIVFISSLAIWSPSVGNAIYSASKAAIASFANCLSLELAPRKIRVNCISPAMVWTDLVYTGGVTEEDLKKDEQSYPLKRYGTPDDIANLAIYLLSDASSWMTGTNVKISGGG